MGRSWVVCAVVVLGWFTACGGGRSLGEGPGEDSGVLGDNESRTPAEPPAPGGKSDGSGDGDPFDFGAGAPLPECVAGFRQSDKPDKPCNCLVQGVCFDDKAQACACICPRTGKQNVCVSDQECEEGSRTKVRCYSL
jgi:hypothetical protein